MSSASDPAPQPSSKRARTRALLLDIAADLFRKNGIANVSLDEIAGQAGLTKGAIYGNFKSKDDLVYAVVIERSKRTYFDFEAGTPIRDQLRAIVHHAFNAATRKRGDYAFLAELDRYAMGSEDLSRRFVAASRDHHERMAKVLEAFSEELKLPPLQFAIAVQAIIGGLQFQAASHPGTVTEETPLVALEGLLKS
jgi:AcrR family transcriptional regulator